MTLWQKQAEKRFDSIKEQSISYHLHLNLQAQGYQGLSQIQFTLSKITDDLFLDCTTKQLVRLIINSTEISKQDIKHMQSHLYLNQDKLIVGVNIVLVQYSNIYNTDERGLMSFVDVDKNQYLYTTFQPYFAHRVFAIFDQPDLKAPMTLSVTCPLSWTRILSNQAPIICQQFKVEKYLSTVQSFDKSKVSQFIKQVKESRMAIFPITKPMSTYLYVVIAGSFVQFQLKQRYNNIPMSFYCSKSQQPYVQKMIPFLFEVTVQSMKFFQQFFGVPYCFSKYDQIFVHEMQSCAMQNTGMVTYHDAEYIWKEQATVQHALDLANTMAHELAHHWFGNLTTMKWWDDLWLNQSFAEFISYYVFQFIGKNIKTIKLEPGMAQFLYKKCSNGYVQDKLSCTHAIRGPVQNSHIAQSIFDGITYAKGAATLKQLVFLMGGQNFSAALKDYFTKYAYKNTTLDEFINCLQQKFDSEHGVNLHQWKKVWIQQPSLNKLSVTWWKSDSKTVQPQPMMTITQKPYTETYPQLRPHNLKIALFKKDCSYDAIQVFIPAQPEISVPFDPQSAKEYEAVLLNYEDHAYAQVLFDPYSLQFFTHNLVKIRDMLTRAFIWRNFYDMVVDGQISSNKYIDLFVENIEQEPSDTLVQKNYQCAISSVQLYTPKEYQNQYKTRLFYLTLNLLQSSKQKNFSANRVVILKSNLCRLAQTQLSVKVLYTWYSGTYQSLPAQQFEISSLNRWEIAERVVRFGRLTMEKIQVIIEKQYNTDNSQLGNLCKLKLQAIMSANNEQKLQELYNKLLDPHNSLTVNSKKYLTSGLNTAISNSSLQLQEKYTKRFGQDVQKIIKDFQSQHIIVFVENMLPTANLQEAVKILRSLSLEHQKLSKTRYRVVKLMDKLERRIKAHQLFRQNVKI